MKVTTALGILSCGFLLLSGLPVRAQIVIDKNLQVGNIHRDFTDMTPCQLQDDCPLRDDLEAPEFLPDKDDYFSDDYDGKTGCGKGFCGADCGCGRSGGLTFEFEWMFLKYGQEGGVTDQVGNSADFDFEFAPRIELGYQSASGLGLRSRYWQFDHGAVSNAGNPIAVDAYSVDLELYDSVDLPYRFDLEGAAGVRAAGFSQVATDLSIPSAAASNWDGFGGTLAVEARRRCRVGKLYARGRCSALMGDASIANTFGTTPPTVTFQANDNLVYQAELGFGYELSRHLGNWGVLDTRVGVEWQNWTNVAVCDTAFGGIGNNDVLEDGGFAGLAFAVGLRR